MELVDINKELLSCIKNLRDSSNKIFTLAAEKAEAEKAYRKALQQSILEQRTNGLQATLIPDVARGLTSELKFARDLAEAKYNSARDYIEAMQVSISAYQTILKYQTEV